MYNPYQQQQYGFSNQQQQGNFAGGFNGQAPFNQPQNGGFVFGGQQPVQAQQTGYYGSNQGLFNPEGFNSQQTGVGQMSIQPQQTGYLQVQPTGFQRSNATVPMVTENIELKIPNIRLSFITSSDQSKFEHLFRTAVAKGEQAITGDAARDILLRSGLQPITLAEIWSLADTNKSGSLLFPEFALALHLCNLSLKGDPLPSKVPEKWNNEVKSFVDAINFSVPEDPSKILANTPFSNVGGGTGGADFDWLSNSNQGALTSVNPPTSFGMPATEVSQQQPMGPMRTGNMQFNSQQTGISAAMTAQRTGGGSLIPLQPQQTASLIPAQRTGNAFGGFSNQRTGTIGQPSQFNEVSNSLQPQVTGFQPNNIVPQLTGFQPQLTGMRPQRTGSMVPTAPSLQQNIQPQQTGPQGLNTGFPNANNVLQNQATGLSAQRTGSLVSQRTGTLMSQPTGIPGQWGFVSMPTGGIPGLNAMEQHFLPSSQIPSNNLQNLMGGDLKTNVTWAITKEEKQIYDGIFKAWDTTNKGYVDGNTAIGIFGKSGLSRPDLESIWNLSDSNNSGKLNKDEFAVAMHLVYRRLNGFDIPLRLPPELVPPSTKYIQDSVDSLKTSLKRSGTSRSKSDFKGKTDGSRFKNDDTDISYVSNMRHRRANTTKEKPKSSYRTAEDVDITADELKKMIKEKKILLAAADIEDEERSLQNGRSNKDIVRQIEALKTEIFAVQAQIDEKSLKISYDDRRQLLDRLNRLTKDQMPALIAKIHNVNNDIAKAKVEHMKNQLLKTNPNWNFSDAQSGIVGTGANGEITKADIHRYKSKQLLKKRMAALTGKSLDDENDLDSKYQDAVEKAQAETDSQTAMITDIESGIKELEESCFTSLSISTKEGLNDDRWEKGISVQKPVSDFIAGLNESSKKKIKSPAPVSDNSSISSQYSSPGPNSAPKSTQSSSGYSNQEERAAYIKAQAEKRMNERLAKLGITRHGSSEEKTKANNSDESHKERNTTKPDPQVALLSEPSPKPEIEQKKDMSVSNKPPANEKKDMSISSNTVQASEKKNPDDLNESDSEDEEYKALLRQKAELEARERERKLKRKKEKEEKLAKLKKEMEALKMKEESSSDEDESEETKAIADVPVYKAEHISSPSNSYSATKTTVTAANSLQKEESTSRIDKFSTPAEKPAEKSASHKGNPFVHMNTNPFFKPNDQQASNSAQHQINTQRSAPDDDWSDEEENSSEEEDHSRSGAAQLANLLFGGGQQPSRTESFSNAEEVKHSPSTIDSTKDVIEESDKNKSLPIAASDSTISLENLAGEEMHRPIPSLNSVLSDSGESEHFNTNTESNSDDTFSFYDASSANNGSQSLQVPASGVAPQHAEEAPPLPDTMPPIPAVAAPPAPPMPAATAPPAPPMPAATAPPAPPMPAATAPPAPPMPAATAPPAPPMPAATAPPAPPMPAATAPPAPPMPAATAPPAPPMPAATAPPAPPMPAVAAASSNNAGGPPDLSALLGQIHTGTALRKVDENEKHESSGAVVGRVL